MDSDIQKMLSDQNRYGKIFFRVLLSIFIVFHVLYMVFLFENLKQLELSKSIEAECVEGGSSPMEMETRRYQIYKYYNLHDFSLWESALNITWLFVGLVMIMTIVFVSQGKILWNMDFTIIFSIAILFMALDLYILKSRFNFSLTNLFSTFSFKGPESNTCNAFACSLNGISRDGRAVRGKDDLTLRADTQRIVTYYKDLASRLKDRITCTSPIPSSKCPYIMSVRLKRLLLARIMASTEEYIGPAEAQIKLDEILTRQDYYEFMSYLKLEKLQLDLKEFGINAHELEDLAFADAYRPIKDRVLKNIAVSYIPIVLLIYIFVIHPRYQA